MNFADERYVRLFTRDTPAWVMLPWQARALLPLLLRKLDRIGEIDLGDDGYEALAQIVGLPLEVVSVGVEALLKRGTVVSRETSLVAPRFLQAQESRRSDVARQADSRARRRSARLGDVVSHAVTPGHTNDDASAHTEYAEKSPLPSHAVTPGHTPSRRVTPSDPDPDPDPDPKPSSPLPVTPERDTRTEPTEVGGYGSEASESRPVALRDTAGELLQPLPPKGSPAEVYRMGEVFAETIREQTGKPWGLPGFSDRPLRTVATEHAEGITAADRVVWLSARIVTWIGAVKDNPIDHQGFDPKRFLAWLNGARSSASSGSQGHWPRKADPEAPPYHDAWVPPPSDPDAEVADEGAQVAAANALAALLEATR